MGKRFWSPPFLLASAVLLLLLAALSLLLLVSPPPSPFSLLSPPPPPATAASHILFAVASSARSLPHRAPFIRLWCGGLRALVFLDAPLSLPSLPPLRISSPRHPSFPYTFRGGLPSAVRVARIVSDAVAAVSDDDGGIRWVVLADDDTVLFPENLAAVLRRYDHTRFFYIGGRSESAEQNARHSFNMAFGGGGVALSYPLAKALARVLDSCLMRYGHLYGSDARIFACLAELGVPFTHEPGFHQTDLRGNIFGMLAAHPLTPFVSLHHVGNIDPIFPGMDQKDSLKHLFEAVDIDSGRIFQQAVCYDQLNLLTLSISWGYAVQVYEGNQLLPDLLSLLHTFSPWKRTRAFSSAQYTFNTRDVPKDPCSRPVIFFLESVKSSKDVIESTYTSNSSVNCSHTSFLKHLRHIRVSSMKLDPITWQAPRRQCCDKINSASQGTINVLLRQCKDDELIAMNP